MVNWISIAEVLQSFELYLIGNWQLEATEDFGAGKMTIKIAIVKINVVVVCMLRKKLNVWTPRGESCGGVGWDELGDWD